MMVEFRKFSEFPRGTLYDILQDAYSYDSRNKELWDENWQESDKFFYDNPEIMKVLALNYMTGKRMTQKVSIQEITCIMK